MQTQSLVVHWVYFPQPVASQPLAVPQVMPHHPHPKLLRYYSQHQFLPVLHLNAVAPVANAFLHALIYPPLHQFAFLYAESWPPIAWSVHAQYRVAAPPTWHAKSLYAPVIQKLYLWFYQLFRVPDLRLTLPPPIFQTRPVARHHYGTPPNSATPYPDCRHHHLRESNRHTGPILRIQYPVFDIYYLSWDAPSLNQDHNHWPIYHPTCDHQPD